MITTFRNLDKKTLNRFKAEAKQRGQTMGEALTSAMQQYLIKGKSIDLALLRTWKTGEKNKPLSKEIDETLYGNLH